MSMRFSADKVRHNERDSILFALLILLVGLGLSLLFSASYDYGRRHFGDPRYFLQSQTIRMLIGSAGAVLASRISLEALRKGIPLVVVAAFLLLLGTFIPGVGRQIYGARRWINVFGTSFQPSEFVKFAVILYLAHIFDKKGERIEDFVNAVLPPLLVVGAFVGLIYLQNDFSTSMFVLCLALAIFFVAGARLVYLGALMSAFIPMGIMLLLVKEHRVQRLVAFLDPSADPVGSGYQVNAALDALSRGGFWGVGLGNSIRKLGGLPEAHSDFLFAIIGEETGFLGVVFIIALFVCFAVKGYGVAIRQEQRFRFLLAFGITTAVVYQALLNLAVVCGLVPATGVPLPFFSHGGTSILITLVMCGLLLNVSRRSGGGRAE
jgi:cell division protein FtsW